MSEHFAENARKVTEWAVRANGYFHPFADESFARIVFQEQGGELLSRTVTFTEWRQVAPTGQAVSDD